MLRPRPETSLVDEARATTERVARTFALACRLLPRSVRDDVYLLYLTFRTLDDLVDEGDPRALARIVAVEAWAAGEAPTSRESCLLADLATRHPLPRDAVLDFCRGMRDDLEERPIDTEEELDRYCYRVAGTVGVVMAAVLGVRAEGAERQAAALGMAMQRTNIVRDIDEDLASGRIYLARRTVARFGAPSPGAREGLIRHQIARADALYEEGLAGVVKLRRGRRAVAAAAAMYREILRQIEREHYGARAGRVVVPHWRKLRVAAPRALTLRQP